MNVPEYVILLSNDNFNQLYVEKLLGQKIFPDDMKQILEIEIIDSEVCKYEIICNTIIIDTFSDENILNSLKIMNKACPIFSTITIKYYTKIIEPKIKIYPHMTNNEEHNYIIKNALLKDATTNCVVAVCNNNVLELLDQPFKFHTLTTQIVNCNTICETALQTCSINDMFVEYLSIKNQKIKRNQRINAITALLESLMKQKKEQIEILEQQKITIPTVFTFDYCAISFKITNNFTILPITEENIQKKIRQFHNNIINTLRYAYEKKCNNSYFDHTGYIMRIINKHIEKEIDKGYIMFALENVKSEIILCECERRYSNRLILLFNGLLQQLNKNINEQYILITNNSINLKIIADVEIKLLAIEKDIERYNSEINELKSS